MPTKKKKGGRFLEDLGVVSDQHNKRVKCGKNGPCHAAFFKMLARISIQKQERHVMLTLDVAYRNLDEAVLFNQWFGLVVWGPVVWIFGIPL